MHTANPTKPNFAYLWVKSFPILIRHTHLPLFSLIRLASAICGLLHPPSHIRVNPKCSSAKANATVLLFPPATLLNLWFPTTSASEGSGEVPLRRKWSNTCRLAVLPCFLDVLCLSSSPEWSWPDNRDRLCPGDWAPGLPSWQQIESTTWTMSDILCLILLNNAKKCKR